MFILKSIILICFPFVSFKKFMIQTIRVLHGITVRRNDGMILLNKRPRN